LDRWPPNDAQPLGQPDRREAALLGSPSASPPGGRLPQTLGLVTFSAMVPIFALLRPSLLRFRLSHLHCHPLSPSPLLASAFSLGMLLRYAHVTMSMRRRPSFSATACPSAPAVGTALLAFSFVRLLPPASLSAGSSTVCRRSGHVGGSSWQTFLRNANASEDGGRRLPHSAVAGSFRAARALCSRLVSQGLPTRSATTAWPNPSIQGTSCKPRFACLQVPSPLRGSAAPDLER
jgi:hypothetical protein